MECSQSNPTINTSFSGTSEESGIKRMTESGSASSDNGFALQPLPPVRSVTRQPRHYNCVRALRDGAKFKGEQSGSTQRCPVEVVFESIDYDSFTLCGRLTICNLHPEPNSETTTFFQGEIICEKHPFLTRKWEADYDIDQIHWSKFTKHFKQFETTFNDDDFDYNKLINADAIFMRWKELFIIPKSNPNSKESELCSFSGFYYICLEKSSGTIEGFYFQKNPQDNGFQNLKLEFQQNDFCGVYMIR
ncbi:glucose-induced degradation protein 4 homolog [Convolutriloba macropyga]|uniref:glucose-induced degradation protein 4 homolog n=1 Tax=Convolutriloba macropyga TaxID=536237 RepID=UPI003F52365E